MTPSPLLPLNPGQVVDGSLFNEPMRFETIRPAGADRWTVGLVGLQTEKFRSVTLSAQDLRQLHVRTLTHTFTGDGALLRLGLQAYALGIAYEFDPCFGLSISRVDPLPHQLEAVYDYLLKLARVRFLLADDAGAGRNLPEGGAARPAQAAILFRASLLTSQAGSRHPRSGRRAGDLSARRQPW